MNTERLTIKAQEALQAAATLADQRSHQSERRKQGSGLARKKMHGSSPPHRQRPLQSSAFSTGVSASSGFERLIAFDFGIDEFDPSQCSFFLGFGVGGGSKGLLGLGELAVPRAVDRQHGVGRHPPRSGGGGGARRFYSPLCILELNKRADLADEGLP